MRIAFIIFVLAATTGVALAQPDDPRAGRRAQVRQRIRAVRMAVLFEKLALDAPTAGRLSQVLDRYEGDIEAANQKAARLRRQLKRALAERGDAGSLEQRTDELVAQYEALVQLQRDRLRAARRVVTPEQGARLLLLLPRIDEAVRKKIDRAVRRGKMGRRGRERKARLHRGDEDDVIDPYDRP